MPEEKYRRQIEEDGKIVEFPSDETRMPTQELPRVLGRIPDSHPLQKPLRIAILVLGIVILIMVISAVYTSLRNATNTNESQIINPYREPGTITYMDQRIEGWFLEESREHFMDKDGKRYTYVDSHTREGSRVMGYWRKME
jgi:hypothetical protein